MSAQVCKNCGESIELVNYALGPQWMHNPPGYTSHKTAGGAYNVFRPPSIVQRYLATIPEGQRIPEDKRAWVRGQWAKAAAERDARQ